MNQSSEKDYTTDFPFKWPDPEPVTEKPSALHLQVVAKDEIPVWKAPPHDGPLAITETSLAEAAGEKPSVGQRIAFAYIHASDLGGVSEALDFVEGLLTEGGASVLYGPSNCGKSFWIVDLGAAVASGRNFRGELEVDRGSVIYVALEGAHGAKNRMGALRKKGLLKSGDPFYLVFDQVSLLEPGHADKLAQTVAAVAKDSGQPVKLVILDTMARAMAGGDENSGADMTLAVKAIDAVPASCNLPVACKGSPCLSNRTPWGESTSNASGRLSRTAGRGECDNHQNFLPRNRPCNRTGNSVHFDAF